ncbi:MAG: response regulator [Armatimonadota bacterium]|nr:MAG: response regulator [Armatimonadota bacterium]
MPKLRVLIADDESVIRMDLSEMLTEAGYEVAAAVATGEEAIAKARSERPDVAIVDIKMPGMDGIDAARVMIEEEICAVVLLTAYGQPELVQRAREAGVFGYVTKPFEERDLLPAIEIARSRYEEVMELKGQVGNLEEAIETRKLVERAKGILMDGHGLTEREAYRRIQQESMNRRKSMREIAEAVILASDVGGREA